MIDILIIYLAFGWFVAIAIDIAEGDEPPYYVRIIPLWPIALGAILIVWVASRLGSR